MVGEFFGGSTRKVRDDVWGDVPVDKAVRALLETAAMSRLKGMSQLGFTLYAFPSAKHTRFDHSVGVYYLTRLTLKRIIDSGAYLEDHDVRASLAAALLHDTGRYPYASSVEGIKLPGMLSRDEASRRLIEETEVADILTQSWDLEPHNVFRLIAQGDRHYHDDDGMAAGEPTSTPLRHLTPTEYLTRDLLSGSLDVGTLDSLARDARAAKVSYGTVDAEALVGSLRIVGQDNRALIAVDEAGVGYLQSLVFARYLMHYNVYGHYALRIPTVMFLRAAQDALQTENITSEQLTHEDDAGALALITRASAPESSSAILVKRLGDRRPYKPAIEFDERHSSYASLVRLRDDAAWRRRVEEAWARYLTRYRKGVAGPFDILIDLPERRRFDIGLRLIRRSPLPGERNPVNWQDISGLTEEDMVRYHAPLHRIRIVTANDDLATSVRRHIDELFTIAEEVG
ncbi:MAG: HD domain-containing protein [Actinomycetota bacterium]|nr:HD domain-containing protein [Actinomycetota bacterium]